MLKSILLIALLSFPTLAQVDLSAFLAVPVGDFGSSTGGAAQTRMGLSAGLSKAITDQLYVGGEADAIMNTLDKERFAQALSAQAGGTLVSAKGGSYFNFPLLLNLSFKIPIQDPYSFRITGGLGYDFMSMMDLDIEINGNKGTLSFDPAGALAYSLGGMISFGNIFIGAKYLGLGNHSITITTSGPSGKQNSSSNQDVAVTGILAGFAF